MQRRELFRHLSFLTLTGGAVSLTLPASAKGLLNNQDPASPLKRDLFKELGIRTFINAAGTYTAMTGSLMHDYVVETIQDASHQFCMLDEVQDKVGEKK